MAKNYALSALDLMTTSDVARELGVTVRSVQLWVEQGALEGWKTPGGHRRITRESFNRLVKSRANNRSPSSGDTTDLRVVIVEDDSALLMLYRKSIETWKLPISLECLISAVEALISISKSPPDLLVTDLRMPEMDGFALLESIRKTDIFSRMAVVVVTGLQPDEIEKHGGLPKGVRLYGKSPIPFWEMKEFIQGLIDKKQALVD